MVLLLCKAEGRRAFAYGWKKAKTYSGKKAGRQSGKEASISRALEKNNNGPVAELDARIAGLEQEILKRNRARQDYDDLGREVIRLREEKYQLQLEDAEKEGMRKKLTELEETMDEIGGQVTEYYDALVRRLIEWITVHDDRYVVEFKSGIKIDVRL